MLKLTTMATILTVALVGCGDDLVAQGPDGGSPPAAEACAEGGATPCACVVQGAVAATAATPEQRDACLGSCAVMCPAEQHACTPRLADLDCRCVAGDQAGASCR